MLWQLGYQQRPKVTNQIPDCLKAFTGNFINDKCCTYKSYISSKCKLAGHPQVRTNLHPSHNVWKLQNDIYKIALSNWFTYMRYNIPLQYKKFYLLLGECMALGSWISLKFWGLFSDPKKWKKARAARSNAPNALEFPRYMLFKCYFKHVG